MSKNNGLRCLSSVLSCAEDAMEDHEMARSGFDTRGVAVAT